MTIHEGPRNPAAGLPTVRFDMEKSSAVLEKFSKHPDAHTDVENIRRAALALVFVWSGGCIDNFEDLLTCFSQSDPLNASVAFDTQEQAQAWLRQPLDDRQITEPEEVETIRAALLALHYIVESGQARDFERYLEDFDTPAAYPPLRSFETRTEAEAWVKAHPRPPKGARLDIAGQRFSVVYGRDVNLRALLRQPSLEELGLLEGWDKDDEES